MAITSIGSVTYSINTGNGDNVTSQSELSSLTFSATVSGTTGNQTTFTLYYSLDNVNWISLNVTASAKDNSGSITFGNVNLSNSVLNNINNQAVYFQIRGGGINGATNGGAHTFDTVSATPTVHLTTDSGSNTSDGITNIKSLTGTADAGATVKVTVGASTYTVQADSSGKWTLDSTHGNFNPADGTYNVTVTATDTAGNISAQASLNNITFDATPPSGISFLVGGDANNDGTVNLPAGEHISYTIKGLGAGETASVTFTDSVTHKTVTFTGLTNGTYNTSATDFATFGTKADGKISVTATLTATDQAGNSAAFNGNAIEAVICFYPGTLIATPEGERAVETLKIGDLVLTTEGKAAPVRWMGRQTVSRVFGDAMRVLPIRIQAGALGANLPVRDLLVSPDHALMLDGVLVQAGALVNGTTIRREADVPQVYTYHHVELADHSLILAEGVAAETFVDNIDRMAFDNWDEHEALYGHLPTIPELDLPRAKSARQVPMALRHRLAARAAELTGTAAAAA